MTEIPEHLAKCDWYKSHKLWLESKGEEGAKANLRRADLRGANLWGASLQWTDLQEIDLRRADLRGANLWGASLKKANLRKSDLRGANLGWVDLRGADLEGADLRGTVLSQWKRPNGDAAAFERDPHDTDLVIGYRTKHQIYMFGHDYEPGKTYRAPVFSCCPETRCHPGLYLEPSPDNLEGVIVKVWTPAKDVHHVCDKWRTKRFVRVEDFTTRHMRGDMRHGS